MNFDILTIAVLLEVGFVIWYFIGTVTLLFGGNGFNRLLSGFTLTGFLSSIWLILIFDYLPTHLLLWKILGIDIFKALIITIIMYRLIIKGE